MTDLASSLMRPATLSARLWAGFRANWPACLTALAFLPLLALHLNDVWARPHYEFVPLLIPGAVLLIWQRVRNLGVLEPGDRVLALPMGVLVWALLAMAILFVSSWLGAVAALLALLAGAFAMGGRPLARAITPAVVLLSLAIPPPFHLDYTLVGRLQAIVSRCAGLILDLFKIDHVMEGNVIDLGSRQLLVDQACSGINSLFTLGAFTLFYILWTRASWMRAAVLLFSAIFWVIAGNVLRVATIGVLAARFGIDATAGKKHTALGIIGFALMVLMVVCTDRLLAFARSSYRLVRHHAWGTAREVARASWGDLLFRWDEVLERRDADRSKRGLRWRHRHARDGAGEVEGSPDATETDTMGSRRRSGPTLFPDVRRTWLGTMAGGLAFALLLIPQTRLPALDWSAILADRDVEARAFAALDESAMPEKVAEMRRIGFRAETRDHDLTWGENSRTWSYGAPLGSVMVSLDYPFVGWHDLTDCYLGRGYQVVSRRVVATGESGQALLVDLSRRDGRFARLLFGLFDREGKPLRPPDDRGFFDALTTRVSSWRLTDAPAIESSRPTHQVQVIQMSASPPKDNDSPDLLALYRQAVTAVHRNPLTGVARPEPAP
jgi:exosortase